MRERDMQTIYDIVAALVAVAVLVFVSAFSVMAAIELARKLFS